MTSKSLEDRFWEKVAIVPFNECWEWIGGKITAGYGSIMGDDRRQHGAHRVCWELVYGKIPRGLWVLHRCDNPSCVNPSHLFVGTYRDNIDDCVDKKRHSFGERNGRAKLTSDNAREIAGRLMLGEQQRPLAREFGVSQRLVLNIAKRRAWRAALA
jgi:hypothetical protein